MRQALIIARYTMLEILKSKILYNVLFLGIGLLVITYVAYSFTYGEPSRVALDFGLGCLSLSSVAIAVFIGVGILSTEIESRTVYMIISRPVPRYSFILGKYLGLSAVLAINVILLSLITLSMFFAIGGEYNSLIPWAVAFTYLESLLVLAIVGTFSLLSGKIMSVMYTIAIYVLGHGISTALETSFVKKRAVLESFLDAYHFVLPAFYKISIREYVIYQSDLSSGYLFSNLAYGVIYTLGLILISTFIFNRKNLD
ncbi:MAG: ABC transporter permease subunit [Bdellovibrionota bacterium]|nr:ABC transporter permease subunit [Bdellovibrionota bacterium]